MSTQAAARAEIVVDATPADAFRMFTDEIGFWWKPGTRYFNDPERAHYLRLEAGVGGRWLEVYDPESGDGYEVGRVTVWEPPGRLGLTWGQVGWPDAMQTELDLTFEPVEGGTLVRLAHSGFEPLGAEAEPTRAGYEAGWNEILGWLAEHAQSAAREEER